MYLRWKIKMEKPVFTVNVDEKYVEELYLQKLEERMKELDSAVTLWDAKELRRQTNMSWNTIQDQFFFHPDFPKRKVGNKWYFPAKKARAFILDWIEEKL